MVRAIVLTTVGFLIMVVLPIVILSPSVTSNELTEKVNTLECVNTHLNDKLSEYDRATDGAPSQEGVEYRNFLKEEISSNRRQIDELRQQWAQGLAHGERGDAAP